MAKSTGEPLEDQMLRQKQHITSLEHTLSRYKANARKAEGMQERIEELERKWAMVEGVEARLDDMAQQVQALTERVGRAEVHVEQVGCGVSEALHELAHHVGRESISQSSNPDPPFRIDPDNAEQVKVVAETIRQYALSPNYFVAPLILRALRDMEGAK